MYLKKEALLACIKLIYIIIPYTVNFRVQFSQFLLDHGSSITNNLPVLIIIVLNSVHYSSFQVFFPKTYNLHYCLKTLKFIDILIISVLVKYRNKLNGIILSIKNLCPSMK